MHDTTLYARILGIESPWRVSDVKLDLERQTVEVLIEREAGKPLACPDCAGAGRGYDSRERRWRHLDTCQLHTVLVARVPRVSCPEHGVRQVAVAWAEEGSRLTALFEALVIDWLREASVSAVARRLGLSFDAVAGVMARAVQRGLARREGTLPAQLAVDETAFQRRHEYVTVVSEQSSGRVLHVADGRNRQALEDFFASHNGEACAAVKTVSMDMWGPYIAAVRAQVPEAERKICFDKFHVAAHLGEAVNQVRRSEHRALSAEGDRRLAKTRFLRLSHPANLSRKQWRAFAALRESSLKTARAWVLKETAMSLWDYWPPGWARRGWQHWLAWAQRCRLEPMCRVGRMVRKHLWGIINAVVHKVTNARAEGVNAKVQWLKYMARGYRNRENFRNAIYFHLGGLDLYPAGTTR